MYRKWRGHCFGRQAHHFFNWLSMFPLYLGRVGAPLYSFSFVPALYFPSTLGCLSLPAFKGIEYRFGSPMYTGD